LIKEIVFQKMGNCNGCSGRNKPESVSSYDNETYERYLEGEVGLDNDLGIIPILKYLGWSAKFEKMMRKKLSEKSEILASLNLSALRKHSQMQIGTTSPNEFFVLLKLLIDKFYLMECCEDIFENLVDNFASQKTWKRLTQFEHSQFYVNKFENLHPNHPILKAVTKVTHGKEATVDTIAKMLFNARHRATWDSTIRLITDLKQPTKNSSICMKHCKMPHIQGDVEFMDQVAIKKNTDSRRFIFGSSVNYFPGNDSSWVMHRGKTLFSAIVIERVEEVDGFFSIQITQYLQVALTKRDAEAGGVSTIDSLIQHLGTIYKDLYQSLEHDSE